MAREIELKLALPEAEQRRFLRSPILRDAGARSSGKLVNIYYDTADLALHCNGIALRLRRCNRRWLQTVKCAGTSRGGLSSRPEWEGPYGGWFDFSAVDDAQTRKMLERFRARLVPVFESSFLRSSWNVRAANSELLLALDRGNITANGKSSTISEVEIELVSGRVDGIFLLANRLAQDFTLTPAPQSKAERGYGLFLGARESPAHASPIPLDDSISPLAAFRLIAQSCLDHLQQNHHGAVHGDDAEYIHQMRVALRRMGAALRLFKPLLPAPLGEHLLPAMSGFMTVLGNARDLDVLTSEIVEPVVIAIPAEPRIAALASVVAAHRQAARQAAIKALNEPAYGRFLLLAMRELHRLSTDSKDGEHALADYVNEHLKHLRRKVMRLTRAARQDDPASLHALRIGAKRLRYKLEFFAPLLPARRSARMAKQLTRLQDILGQLNDLANAGTVLMDCAGNDPGLREAVSLIGGWHGQRYSGLLARVPRSLQKLQTTRLPKAE